MLATKLLFTLNVLKIDVKYVEIMSFVTITIEKYLLI